MKRLFILALLFIVSIATSFGQKLVIGSQVDDHKNSEQIEWYSAPKSSSSVWVIDFYSSDNPTSVEFYNSNIERIGKSVGSDADIIIISGKATDDFQTLSQKDGENYAFGVDSKGNLFKLFGVKYIPYTVIVNNKGKVLWQGNLSTLTDQIIKKVL